MGKAKNQGAAAPETEKSAKAYDIVDGGGSVLRTYDRSNTGKGFPFGSAKAAADEFVKGHPGYKAVPHKSSKNEGDDEEGGEE